MVKNNAWKPVKKSLLPKGTKVIDSTWATRFKQVEGVHYNRTSTQAPVRNAGTIQIMLILMIMANWQG